jgi:DNA-binding CsgD family transcriptional regulator
MGDDSDEIRVSTLRLGDVELAVVSIPQPDPQRFGQLTPAEVEVVRLVLDGLTNSEIAERRGVSDRTVANQLASVYRKLNVNSRAELVAALLRSDESE